MGRLALAGEICAHRAGAITNAGQLISQLRLIEHFLDVAQAIGPVPEIPARNGSGLFGAGFGRTIKESAALCPGASLTLSLLLLLSIRKLASLASASPGILTLLLLSGLAFAGLLTLALALLLAL
ncbi:MAG: hypothetical protein L0Z50_20250, partial [Verrucomicrobiales bacterium]|nr:hypothetical protein [Verrucomicrobiales bacterium]